MFSAEGTLKDKRKREDQWCNCGQFPCASTCLFDVKEKTANNLIKGNAVTECSQCNQAGQVSYETFLFRK